MPVKPAGENPEIAKQWIWVVVLLSVLCYAPALGNGFALDDTRVAGATSVGGQPLPMIHDSQPITEFFTSHYWRDTSDSSDLYRPVTKLSYAWVYHYLGKPLGNEALPQHALNLLLHGWAVWLLCSLLLAVGVPRVAALAGALVFGVHAIHTEVVASIVGRAELFAFSFGAAGALLLVKERLGWRLWLGAVLLFLAFGSKESAVAWAPFVLLLAWLGGVVRDRRLALAVAVVVPLGLFLLLRHLALSGLPDPVPADYIANPLAHIGFAPRILTAITLWGYGLGKTLVPFGLSSDYGPAVFAIVRDAWSPRFLLSAVLLTAIVAGGLLAFRRRPLLFLAMASFFGFSALTSNVAFPIGILFAERLFYSPSMGLAFLVAALAATPQRRSRLALVLLGAWCLYNAVYSFDRSFVWKDSPTLAINDVELQPRSAFLQRQAAGVLVVRGDKDAAMRRLEEAVRLVPEYADAWQLLGLLHQQNGNVAAMESAIRRAIEVAPAANPDYRASLHTKLATALARRGHTAEALAEGRTALELDPDNPRTLLVLLDLGTGTAPEQEVEQWLAAGERIAPHDPRFMLHRGLFAHRKGQHDAAINALTRAARAGVAEPSARLALAESHMHAGNRAEALRLARQLAGDAAVPQDVRARAGALVRRLR